MFLSQVSISDGSVMQRELKTVRSLYLQNTGFSNVAEVEFRSCTTCSQMIRQIVPVSLTVSSF